MTMKTRIIVNLLACSAAAAVAAEPARKVEMRDVVTHDALAARHAKAATPFKEPDFKPEAAAPAGAGKERKPWKAVSLLERSEFLSYNGLTTLVPKGAILNVPPTYAQRTHMVEGVPVVRWSEFYRRNRGWITTLEVSRKQAEADEPLSEETLKSIAKSNSVVVATLAGGPITVLRKPVGESATVVAADDSAKPAANQPTIPVP